MTTVSTGSETDQGGNRGRWLLLIHQLPPTPSYLRVKVRRRLQRLGAQLLKNSVYVLPNSAETLEDLHWLRQEIIGAGGDATVSVAEFVEGPTDEELERQFRNASEAEYESFMEDVRRAAVPLQDRELRRLRARLRELGERDFFQVAGRDEAEHVMAEMAGGRPAKATRTEAWSGDRPVASTWVTRRGVHVDRMASAWLIRRFIDPAATFKFVAPNGYEPESGELRFDMFEGEFTHQADRCTFQMLVDRFSLKSKPLDAIGELVHDIDYKVEPARRDETEGVRVLIRGIGLAHPGDQDRLDAAYAVFDGLYAHFAEE